MRKGMLFSIDAALALVVVILLVEGMTYQLQAREETGGAFGNLRTQALDDAALGLYAGAGGSPSISNEAEFGKCVVVYTLDPDNALDERASPEAKSFCEETR